jgi:hypothetical protein
MTSKAVNRPTNVTQKEEDINQKLQLYGIFTGELHPDVYAIFLAFLPVSRLLST